MFWRPVVSLWLPRNALVLHPSSQAHLSCQPKLKPSANVGCHQNLKAMITKPARSWKTKTATRMTKVCYYFEFYKYNLEVDNGEDNNLNDDKESNIGTLLF